jgi:nascent polypeptide-associated complex subunit alpha
MMPNLDPRKMQKMMNKMGIKQEEIDAVEVIIKTRDKNLIIRNPSVMKVDMMGQNSLQINGDIEEESLISDEDIETVSEQTGASKEDAKTALEKFNGDLAEAILHLKE